MATALFNRWFQSRVFMPDFRPYPAGDPNTPWGRPGAAQRVIVDFIRLRRRLVPYVESTGAVGGPGVNLPPIDMGEYARATMRGRLAAFAFGPSLRIHPVAATETADLGVNLDSGGAWFDFWSGASYAGGQALRIPAPSDMSPIFVSAGAIVPLATVLEPDGEADDPMELRIYPGANGTLNLRETQPGPAGKAAETWIPFTWDDRARVLRIGRRAGAEPVPARPRRFDVVLVCPGRGIGHLAPARPDLRVVYEGEELRLQVPRPPARPAAPAGLGATVQPGRVLFSWQEPGVSVIYRLKRALTPGGPFEDVASALSSPRHEMPLRAGGAPFHCVITAMNAGGESLPSDPVFVVPPPALMPGLPPSVLAPAPKTGERMELVSSRPGSWPGAAAETRGGTRSSPGPVVFTCPAAPRRGRLKRAAAFPEAAPAASGR